MSLRVQSQRRIEPLPTVTVSRNVPMYAQQTNSWCWAACIQMTNNYYHANAQVTQCAVVNRVLARFDCCNTPCPGGCVVTLAPANLGTALTQFNINYAGYAGAIALAVVQSSIVYNRIVFIAFAWTAGGGHAALIRGYDTANTNVIVNDPWSGGLIATYAYVVSGYGHGSWAASWIMSD